MIHRFKCLFAGCLILIILDASFGQRRADDDFQQSRLKVKSLLIQVLDQTNAMDECALRSLLRIRVATQLWSNGSEEDAKEAETVATKALTDLEENKESMPKGMVSWLHSQILGGIEAHAPSVAEQLKRRSVTGQDTIRNDFQSASSMLNATKEVRTSVEAMDRAISSGGDPGALIAFFLAQLELKQPADVPRLLESMISMQERKPATYSLQTLIFLRDFSLRETNSAELKSRYLTIAFNAVLNATSSSDRALNTQAYELLTSLLPVMQALTPSLYSRALPQTAALARQNSDQLERAELNRRVEQSSDPIEQLITEANADKNKVIKNELLVEAAQRAFGDGRLKLAIDIVAAIEFKAEQKIEEQWRDQFLTDVVKSSIEKRDLDTTKHGVSKIKSLYERAAAMQEMALYLFESQDRFSANEVLSDALKLVIASDPSPAKALLLLKLVSAFDRVDNTRVVEVTELAIKAINKVPSPNPSDKPGSDQRHEYVKTLVAIASTIIPFFESLAREDEQRALSLASNLERREVRTAALFGTSMGIASSFRERKTSLRRD